jgi:hypothetical protein
MATGFVANPDGILEKGCWRKLDELCARLASLAESEPGQTSEQRDVAILRSLPGVGRLNLATLLAEAWQPLQRREYSVLRALSGVAPVTRDSGKACIVLRRLACNKRMKVHIFIAFLAHCMQVILTRRLHALAPGLTARSALEKFAATQMIHVHLPTTDGRQIVLTRYTQSKICQLLADDVPNAT